MSMLKIKKGDTVVAITGKDKGKQGEVKQIIDDTKAIVEGINMVKKHQKSNPQQNVEGGVVDEERPLDISNLAIYNPTTQKHDRVGFTFLEDGNKVRYFKSNGEIIDQ